jgi:hypothetical protein
MNQNNNDNKYSIYAQHINKTGIALGSAFKIKSDHIKSYSLSMDSIGNYVFVWSTSINSIRSIKGQRYDAFGVPLGPNFEVNTNSSYYGEYTPCIALNNYGGFVIVWSDGNIHAKCYNSFGMEEAPEFLINYTTCFNINPRPAFNNNDKFVIVWEKEFHSDGHFDISYTGTRNYIAAQRYTGSFTTAIANLSNPLQFKLHPNPAQNRVEIVIEGKVEIKILDLSGHIIKEETLQNNTLDIQDLKTGIYMIEVNQGGRKDIQKLIVE